MTHPWKRFGFCPTLTVIIRPLEIGFLFIKLWSMQAPHQGHFRVVDKVAIHSKDDTGFGFYTASSMAAYAAKQKHIKTRPSESEFKIEFNLNSSTYNLFSASVPCWLMRANVPISSSLVEIEDLANSCTE